MKVLYCDSRGDKRFSALYAKVAAFGVEHTIEEHYQLAKRLSGQPAPTHWKQMKGKKPDFVEIAGHDFPVERLTNWYALLWVWYLDDHPDLVEYAKGFDQFVDRMAGQAMNHQDTMIQRYVKKGRESLLLLCRGLLAGLGLSDALGAARGEPPSVAAAEAAGA